MNGFTNPSRRNFRLGIGLMVILAIVSAAGIAGSALAASRTGALLDGASFPTPTPTATLIPTLSPSASPTLPSLLPTATSIPYPFPTFDSNLVDGGESQAQSGDGSPSLLVLALPFLCALGLVVGIVVYWVRNAQASA